jgi:hypothetical protein
LQFLNHPIANDPCYGKPLNQCINDTISVQNEVDNLESGDDGDGDGDGVISDAIRLPEESLLSFLTRTCEWCQGEKPILPPPPPRKLQVVTSGKELQTELVSTELAFGCMLGVTL